MLAKLLVNAYSRHSASGGSSAAITHQRRPPAAFQRIIVLGAPCGMTMRDCRGAASRSYFFSTTPKRDIGYDGSEDDNQHHTSAAAATKQHTWGPIRLYNYASMSHHARSCKLCGISQIYGSVYGSRKHKGFSPLSEEDKYCPAASTTLDDDSGPNSSYW
jgi:hypothetical protein